MSKLKSIVTWISMSQIQPPIVEGVPHCPDFFLIEKMLAFFSITIFIGAFIMLGLPIIEFFSLTDFKSSSYRVIFLFEVMFLFVGLGAVSITHLLWNRTINQSQYDWLIKVYHNLEMPKPSKNMSKKEIVPYLDKAIKIQTENKLY